MGTKPLDSKVETAKINGRDKYHSDLYRNYLENDIINERKKNGDVKQRIKVKINKTNANLDSI